MEISEVKQAVTVVAAEADSRELAGLGLQAARDLGAAQAEIEVSRSTGLSVTVRLGEVETLEYQRDRGLSVTVYFPDGSGLRKGSASTGDLRPQAIREAVSKACSIAGFTTTDTCAGLADAELMPTSVPDLSLSHPWGVAPEQAIDIARACEAAALATDPRVKNSEGATLNTRSGLHVYGNTHGFIGSLATTDHDVSCSVLAVEGEDMQREAWYSSARDWRDLEDAAAVGRRSAERAVARLGARKLSTRRAPVMFVPEMARGLLRHFIAAISGGSQYRQSSFLLGAAGKQVFPSFVQIGERPHIPKAPGSSPFDGEGVATRDRELVRDGVLQGYVLSSYSARKLGLETTGNAGGVNNLLLSHRHEDRAALLGKMGTGLLVTELMGQGVNTVTGDYSRGASGFWIENGIAQYPVHEVTIAGNLKDMLLGIVAAGSDVDARGVIRTGSMLLEQMTIAGD
jgi:PmbA protein